MLDLHSKRRSPILLERWQRLNMCSISSSRPLREVPQCCRFVSCSVVRLYVRLVYVSNASVYWNVKVKNGPTVFIERRLDPILRSALSSRPLIEIPRWFRSVPSSVICVCFRLVGTCFVFLCVGPPQSRKAYHLSRTMDRSGFTFYFLIEASQRDPSTVSIWTQFCCLCVL